MIEPETISPASRWAHRLTLLGLGVALCGVALPLLGRPGADWVVWPLGLLAAPLHLAAVGGALLAVVASSVAARRGHPRWRRMGFAIFLVLLCAGCATGLTVLRTSQLGGGGLVVGATMWREAYVAEDSATIPALYRCDRTGVVCRLCRLADRRAIEVRLDAPYVGGLSERDGGASFAGVPLGEACP